MKIDLEQASSLMAELGNPTRLRIVRLLVEAGAHGLPVGDIQRELEVPPSTLSHHLSHLRSVGLISQKRQRTTLLCCVDFHRLDAMIRFLTDQCCVRAKPARAKKRKAA